MTGDSRSETRPFATDAIQVLEPGEAIRQRAGMYVGDLYDGSGLLHMVWEVVGNALDQYLARRASRVEVDVDADGWITVQDDGPGIPVDRWRDIDESFLESVFTRMFGSAGLTRHLPHVHLGADLQGWGLAPVCALSERLDVETIRDGNLWAARFERGRIVDPLRCLGATGDHGTTIRFRPDAVIFGQPRIDIARLRARLRELAWLFPHFAISWCGARLPWRGGPAGWVRELAEGECEEGDSFEFSQGTEDGFVDVAIAWTKRPSAVVRAFVNGSAAPNGTHVAGLWKGLVEVARSLGCEASPRVVREILEPGLVSVLHVGLIGPAWRSPDRSDLASPVARTVVARAIRTGFPLACRTRSPGSPGRAFDGVLTSRLAAAR